MQDERDRRGRFARGNAVASAGGKARAAKLSKRRRRQIAKSGWKAMVRRHFACNEAEAKRWWGEIGAWAYDQQAGAGNGIIGVAFPHPGDPQSFRARLYQLPLLVGLHLDVDYYKGDPN